MFIGEGVPLQPVVEGGDSGDVVRLALDLLERDAEKAARVVRGRKAARMVGRASRKVLREFQRHGRLRRLD